MTAIITFLLIPMVNAEKDSKTKDNQIKLKGFDCSRPIDPHPMILEDYQKCERESFVKNERDIERYSNR